jgi:hypothetical protein
MFNYSAHKKNAKSARERLSTDISALRRERKSLMPLERTIWER